MTVAWLDDRRPAPEHLYTRVELSAMCKLQDCIDAIASGQVEVSALVIGLARADAEPIIICAEDTTFGAFDQIVDAADRVAMAVRDHQGPGSPNQEQLMNLIRENWEQRPIT